MTEPRIKAYALTAGGATMLIAGGAANAEIIASYESISIILNEDPTTLFSIGDLDLKADNNTYGSFANYGGATARLRVQEGIGIPDGDWIVGLGNVGYGSSIGPGFTGTTTRQIKNSHIFSNNVTAGSNSDLSLGNSMIVGMAFSNEGSDHYAWVNYSLSWSGSEYTFTINSWAYNDVAGEGIIAGQNVAAGSNAVPGLGGLAALAMGAAGVRSRRQRTVA